MRRFIIVGLLISVSLLGGAALLFYNEFNRAFPELPPGSYAGMLKYESPSDRSTAWYVERATNSKDLMVFLSDSEIPAQRAPGPGAGGTSDSLPLIVSGPNSRLRLIGKQLNADLFEGDFLNPISNDHGKWSLHRIELSPVSQEVEGDVQAWALLWKELQEIDSKFELSRIKTEEQKAKIEKLSKFIVDEDALRKKADSRLGVATDAVQQTRGKIQQLRTQLDTALRDIDLSQRVSTRGRLVLLARESIDREARWVEAGLKLLTPETAPGFDQALERANKVKAIKDEMSLERKKIADLQDSVRYRGENPDTAGEADFYRNLQN